jgi:peptidyl-prolyl cis-trans isomerase C
MQHKRLAGLLIAASICLPSLALAETVAIVNGVAIDKLDVDQAVTYIVNSSNGQAQDTPALREDVKNRLINRELILQEAKHRALDKTPEVTHQISQATQDILQDALFADILKQNPVTDAQVQARYNDIAAKFSNTREVHALQITLKTQADAEKVIADLSHGAAFDKLVKTRSIDPNAKENGGDMGYGNLSTMTPPLAAVLQDLKPGQYTKTPFQSNIGWHVFKVVDVRAGKAPEFEKIKAQILRQLQEEQFSQAVNALRSKATIQ